MSEEMIALDDCMHPEIVEWQGPRLGERLYACTSCKKKIAIPVSTLATCKNLEDIRNIVFMNFGRVVPPKDPK